MSWPITPNGLVVLCRQVPLDRQHTNTVDFPDAATQAAAIRVYEKTEFNNVSYMGNGRIYVEAERDDIAMCNYLMYRNTGFSNKWFYAFITELNYINNDTTEIVFEIDNFQTYMFDYQLQRCYVEREHSLTDAIGDNRVHENLERGEYIQSDGLTPLLLPNAYSNGMPFAIIILTTQQIDYDSTNGYVVQASAARFTQYNGVRSGLSYMVCLDHYNGTNGDALYYAARFTDMLITAGYADSIEAIYLVPQAILNISEYATDGSGYITGVKLANWPTLAGISITNISKDTGAFSYNGKTYTPKNNKMHTAPYKLLYATCLDGNSATYNYEDFYNSVNQDQSVKFTIHGDVSPETALMLCPENYKNNYGTNYDERLVLTGFGTLSCSSDVWRAYLAQHANTLEFNVFSNALQFASGAGNMIAGDFEQATGKMLGAGMSIAQLNAQIADIKALPANANGSRAANSLTSIGKRNIWYSHLQIRPEYAEIIDNYFSMFGYACHKVKVPNTSSRPNWNYVKTVGCNIVATSSVDDSTGLNAAAVDDIKAIYNKGVTIWHSLSVVGHYEYNNQPS